MKARIDHSNYEAWLLDRLEGNLTPEQESELSTFLALHPELDPGETELPMLTETAERLGALDKEALKRDLPPSASVDHRNVEDHLIARLEGDLTPEQLEALRLFLAYHPAHQRAERLYALTKLVPEARAFAAREDLVRALPPQGPPTRHTLDDFLVARLEGELTPAQEASLDAYLSAHPEAKRSWALIQATRVRAADLVFPARASLKKGGRVIPIRTQWVVRLAAAASVAVLIGLAWWALTRTPTLSPQVAEEEKQAPVIEQNVPADKREDKVIGTDERSPIPAVPSEQEPSPMPRSNEASRRQRVIVPQESEVNRPLAQAPSPEQVVPKPDEVPAPIPVRPEEDDQLAEAAPARSTSAPEERSLGQVLAGTVRERLLDQPRDEQTPLGADDAVAAVDKGLKAIGGDRTGLSVERDAHGRRTRLDLRLGRNLAISARR